MLPWLLLLLFSQALAHWPSEHTNLDWVAKQEGGGRRLGEGDGSDGDGTPSPNLAWQCPPVEDENKAEHNKYKLRGVNLGGWMVLEPWITPTLFTQFLGKEVVPKKTGAAKENAFSGQSDVAMDSHSFCIALGAEEANRQLKSHWATWVTELEIAKLSTTGINTVRLPVGDWMYEPYEPFAGCWDGALDEIERLFEICDRYNIKVLLDLHGVKDSQNGFDNSGHSLHVNWTTYSNNKAAGVATFIHWPFRTAEWMGPFDRSEGVYTEKNIENVSLALRAIQRMVDMYADQPAVVGLEPLNEPWQFTPLDWLKDFYWEAYQIVQKGAPHWLYLVHDSFRFDPYIWGDFLKNCPNIGLDTHIYQAWVDPLPQASYLSGACQIAGAIEAMESAGMPVVVGEWSLATDNCAMWLNGFQDNLPGYPRTNCGYKTCPLPYMGPGIIPGAPVNPSMPTQGPFGTGASTPRYGKCPVGAPWRDEDVFMKALAHTKLHAFEHGHGHLFWNWRTELEERWDYLEATDRGWFPQNVEFLQDNKIVKHACDRYTGRGDIEGLPVGVFYEKKDDYLPTERKPGDDHTLGEPYRLLIASVLGVLTGVVAIAVYQKKRGSRGPLYQGI
ncbi:unnamed protein product [Chrysoparadoxa australica]